MPVKPGTAAAQAGVYRTRLAGRDISYRIVRSNRRSIGLKITHEGLTLQLPARFPLSDVGDVLEGKAGWIVAKLDTLAQQQAAIPADLSQVDWLGEPRLLQVHAGRSSIHADAVLLHAADERGIPAALTRLMQREARSFLQERLQRWSQQLGLIPSGLALSGARGRWGSCTSAGNIRLNWRLMQAPIPVIDYVVIHELCHLVEMNHSPRFWALVAAACPDWKTKRAWLKQHGGRYFAW